MVNLLLVPGQNLYPLIKVGEIRDFSHGKYPPRQSWPGVLSPGDKRLLIQEKNSTFAPSKPEMKAKTLISRYLSVFWAVMVVSFLALQVATDLSQEKGKKTDSAGKEYFLLASHSAPSPDLAPDLKALQLWFQHEAEVFVWIGKPAITAVFDFASLPVIRLQRILRTSISINAP